MKTAINAMIQIERESHGNLMYASEFVEPKESYSSHCFHVTTTVRFEVMYNVGLSNEAFVIVLKLATLICIYLEKYLVKSLRLYIFELSEMWPTK